MKIRPGKIGRNEPILTTIVERGQLSLVLLSLAAPPINHQTIMDRKAQTTPVGMESLTIADTPQTTNQPRPRAQSPYTITRRTPIPPQFYLQNHPEQNPTPMGFNQNNVNFSILLQFFSIYFAK
jgi:hypothetical protein